MVRCSVKVYQAQVRVPNLGMSLVKYVIILVVRSTFMEKAPVLGVVMVMGAGLTATHVVQIPVVFGNAMMVKCRLFLARLVIVGQGRR